MQTYQISLYKCLLIDSDHLADRAIKNATKNTMNWGESRSDKVWEMNSGLAVKKMVPISAMLLPRIAMDMGEGKLKNYDVLTAYSGFVFSV